MGTHITLWSDARRSGPEKSTRADVRRIGNIVPRISSMLRITAGYQNVREFSGLFISHRGFPVVQSAKVPAWLFASPVSRRVCHSRALRSNSTTRGAHLVLGGFRFRALGESALISWLAATFLVRVPIESRSEKKARIVVSMSMVSSGMGSRWALTGCLIFGFQQENLVVRILAAPL